MKILQNNEKSAIIKENIDENKPFKNEKIEKSFLCKENEENSRLLRIIDEKKKKFAMKKVLERQKEAENEEKKLEKMNFLLNRNEEIRKSNKTRFFSMPKSKKNDKKTKKKSQKLTKKLNEGERREELGLSWLNGLDETKYEEILERNRSKSQEKSKEIIQNIEKNSNFY